MKLDLTVLASSCGGCDCGHGMHLPITWPLFQNLSIHISELTVDYKQVVGAATTNLVGGGIPPKHCAKGSLNLLQLEIVGFPSY